MKNVLILISAAMALSAMAQTPLWDLQKNKISPELTLGSPTVRDDASVVLDKNSAFAVPASAFPDANNFTVIVKIKYPPLELSAQCDKFLSREDKNGEGIGLKLFRYHHREGYIPRINSMTGRDIGIAGSQGRVNADLSLEYVICAKDGVVSFYCDDVLGQRILQKCPTSNEAMWVGKNRKKFDNLEILELKVYGKDFEYKSKKEKPEDKLRGIKLGKNWCLNVPADKSVERPCVLLCGDSILSGYSRPLMKSLEGKIYLELWSHFAGNPKKNAELYESVAKSTKYDAIVFNNGLHSWHWTPEKVSDKQIADTYRGMVEGFRKGAPKASLFYLTTTPITDGEKPRGLDERNKMVQRLNKIATQVMQEEGVEIIDAYAILEKNLNLSSLDHFHWGSQAYSLMSKSIEQKLLPSIKSK